MIKSTWNEFIYGGHLLSLGAVSIVFTSAFLLKIGITWDYLAIVYLSVHSAYLYNRYNEYKKDFLTNPERTQYLENKIKKLPLVIFCFVFVFIAILLYFNRPSVLFLGVFLFLMSLLYSKFFKKVTKNIVGFKNFYVSFVWAFLVIFLVFYYSAQFNLSLLLVIVFVYSRIFIHESFSDIKDIKSDKKENLLTFPIVLGKEKLINILNVINIFTIIPIILGVHLGLFPVYSLILFFTIIYTFLNFKKAKELNYNQNFLYNVLGDGEFIIWPFFIFIGNFFYDRLLFY